MLTDLSLKINGQEHLVHTDEQRPLLDVLREDLHLTGSKFGCGEGECGACTVLVNGTPTRACITPVGDVMGAAIETIEGLAQDGPLHFVQQAFLDHQALQCGYCVPGHIMTAVALVRENPKATRSEILAALNEHICRCCNYENIAAAAEQIVGPR